MAVKLYSEKVALRKLKLSDANRLAKLANNNKIWQNMRDGFPNPYTLEDAIKFIELNFENNTNAIFAITYNEELVGTTGLHGQVDINRFSMELGYWIGEAYWGNGIATKAVGLIKPILGLKTSTSIVFLQEPFKVI